MTESKVYTRNRYNCGYCGYEFVQIVRNSGGGTDMMGRNTHSVSSQVQCPWCRNFLKTWDGCTKLEEVKAGVIKNRVEKV